MPLPRRQPLTPRPVRRPPRAAYRIPGAPSVDAAEAASAAESATEQADATTTVPTPPTPTPLPPLVVPATPEHVPAVDASGPTGVEPLVSVPTAAVPAPPRSVPQVTEPDIFQGTAALGEPTFTNTVPVDHAAPGETAAVAQSIEAAAQRQRTQRSTAAASTVMAGAGSSAVPVAGGARTARRVGQRVGAGAPGIPATGRGAGAPPRKPSVVDSRPRWRRPRSWFVGAGAIIALVLLAVMIYAGYMGWTAWRAYNKAHVDAEDRVVYTINEAGTPVAVPTEEVEAQFPDWDNDDPVNILLLGIDFRDGDEEPARSDTVMVVRIEPATGAVRMLSIPRDLLVDIPGHGEDKMNAAYPIGEVWGEERGAELGGATLVAQTVESNFDIPIHYFMTVDFNGFRRIVDTVGGIVVDVRAQIKDDQYPTEDFGLTREYYPTGFQFMDGEDALRYARTRHGDNDVNRGQRQQQVLRAIRQQATTKGLITQADDLMRDLADTVRTDLNFNQMLALANLGRSLDTDAIESVDLWEMGYIYEHAPEFEGDAFYFEADWNSVWAVTADLFPRPGEKPLGSGLSTNRVTPTSGSRDVGASPVSGGATGSRSTPSSGGASVTSTTSGVDYDVPIAVRDYTSLGMAASDVAAFLASDGFSLVVPEESASVAPITTIYNYEATPDSALHIADLLGLSSSAVVEASDGVGIVVILGDDVASGFSP